MFMRNNYQLLVILILFIMAGCSYPQRNIEKEGSEATQIQLSYPASSDKLDQGDILFQGYIPPRATLNPTSIAGLLVPDPPNPTKTLGSISGLIVDNKYNLILNDMNICLYHSTEIKDNAFPPFVIGCNLKNGDILGRTDENGVFSFTNVPPGKYYLIMTIDQSPIYKSPGDMQPFLINVESNEIINLGVVYYTSR